ncbi:MAG: response regulator [Myxococcales bacterium]|nr:response regulator [Myxococcales bacterium]
MPFARARPAPDLLITDVMMPKMDGWSLVRQLRSHSELAMLPVIFLTALSPPRMTDPGLSPRAPTTTSPSRSGSRSWTSGSPRPCAGPQATIQETRDQPGGSSLARRPVAGRPIVAARADRDGAQDRAPPARVPPTGRRPRSSCARARSSTRGFRRRRGAGRRRARQLPPDLGAPASSSSRRASSRALTGSRFHDAPPDGGCAPDGRAERIRAGDQPAAVLTVLPITSTDDGW